VSRASVHIYNLGKYEEAANEFRAVYKIQRKELGEEHPSTLSTRNILDLCFKKWGNRSKNQKTEFLYFLLNADEVNQVSKMGIFEVVKLWILIRNGVMQRSV